MATSIHEPLKLSIPKECCIIHNQPSQQYFLSVDEVILLRFASIDIPRKTTTDILFGFGGVILCESHSSVCTEIFLKK